MIVRMEVECPVGGCEYRGEMASVEGHVSSRTDGGHSGLLGRHVRGDLKDQKVADVEPANSAAAGASVAAGVPVLLGGEESPSTAVLVGGLLVVAVLGYLLLVESDGEATAEDRESEPEVVR